MGSKTKDEYKLPNPNKIKQKKFAYRLDYWKKSLKDPNYKPKNVYVVLEENKDDSRVLYSYYDKSDKEKKKEEEKGGEEK